MADRHDMGCFITCVADFLFLTLFIDWLFFDHVRTGTMSNKMEIVLVAFDVMASS